MQTYEVPLKGQSQTFTIALAGVTYQMTLMWRASEPTRFPPSSQANTAGQWVLDMADALGNPLVSGIPLVTGVDLLAPYAYMGFTGSLVVQTDHDTDALPTYSNLGSTSHLYFVVQ